MESEKKRGWWALAAVIGGSVVLLLALYVGAYFWFVEPQVMRIAGPIPADPDEEWKLILANKAVPRYWRARDLYRWIDYQSLFWPIHLIDRRVRQETWREGKWAPEPW